jgi:hypothetical protein
MDYYFYSLENHLINTTVNRDSNSGCIQPHGSSQLMGPWPGWIFVVSSWILIHYFIQHKKLKERVILMRIQMTQMLEHYLQKKYLESTILYLLLIKQFHHLQGGLNNTRASRIFLDSYLLRKHYSHWITRNKHIQDLMPKRWI